MVLEQVWIGGLLWEHIQAILPSIWCIPDVSVHIQPRDLWEQKGTKPCISDWRCCHNGSQESLWLFLQGIVAFVSGLVLTFLPLRISEMFLFT